MRAPLPLDWHARNAHAGASAPPMQDRDRWYRMPIVWLAAAVALATLGGCIVTIVLSLGDADKELASGSERLLGVATRQAPERSLEPRAVEEGTQP
jgi:hypothetical protein